MQVIERLKRAQLRASKEAVEEARKHFVPLEELLPVPKHPRVLCWDIESSNLSLDFGRIFCVGLKWLGQPKTIVRSVMDYPQFLQDHSTDEALCREIAEYLAKADLWVFHFGEYFDVKAVRTRLALHMGRPMPPIKFVDTWRLARKLRLHSNRLDAVAKFFGFPEKTPILPQYWNAANGGYPQAIKYIIDHCRKDIPPLEAAYLRLRAFMTDHPNMNLTYDDESLRNTSRCPVCGSAKLKWVGHSYARTRIRDRWQCMEPDCGAWSVGVTSSIVGEGIR